MTIWGAEFDDEGYIGYIYYADNNFGDQDPLGAACIRKEVTYQKDDIMGLNDQTYLGTSIRITAWCGRPASRHLAAGVPRRPARRLTRIELF